jgi:GT2 family glycosyltransferase
MQWIEKCLTSLLFQTCQAKIICIDNASTDGTPAFIKKHFPSVYLYESGTNLGFGQANNIGLKLAVNNNADYVFLLNQDAWVEKDTVVCLIEVSDENPSFGVLSPVHLNGQGNQMDLNFKRYLYESDISTIQFKPDPVNFSQTELIPTRFVNAAAWLITKECLEKTGGFDPIFFHYGEDRNFLQRVIFKGYKAGIYPGARIFHDRENRSVNARDSLQNRVTREWIHFLDGACDIHRKGFFLFTTKRFFRHSLMVLLNMVKINKHECQFHFQLAWKIFSHQKKIRQSRQQALSSGPYLSIA